MITQFRVLLIAMAGALAIVACGSGGDGAAGTTAGAVSSATGTGGSPSCAHTVGDGGSYTYYTPSCTQAITQGGTPCVEDEAGVMAYDALDACAASSCEAPCAAFVMAKAAVDMECDVCLSASCPAQRTACLKDQCTPGVCP